MIESLGLIGTILIFASFFFNDSKYIRLGNMAGSLLFVIYGLAIGALSVWLLNGACFILNLVKIVNSNQSEVKDNEEEDILNSGSSTSSSRYL